MTPRIMIFIVCVAFFLLVDYYLFQAILTVSKTWSSGWRTGVRYGFWVPTVLCILALAWWSFADPYKLPAGVRTWILTGLFATYFSKIFGIIFVFVDDIQRGIRWVANFF